MSTKIFIVKQIEALLGKDGTMVARRVRLQTPTYALGESHYDDGAVITLPGVEPVIDLGGYLAVETRPATEEEGKQFVADRITAEKEREAAFLARLPKHEPLPPYEPPIPYLAPRRSRRSS